MNTFIYVSIKAKRLSVTFATCSNVFFMLNVRILFYQCIHQSGGELREFIEFPLVKGVGGELIFPCTVAACKQGCQPVGAHAQGVHCPPHPDTGVSLYTV